MSRCCCVTRSTRSFHPSTPRTRQKNTWLEDPTILTDASRKRVQETIGRLAREGKQPTRGRIVAGLSFGFWRALFDKKYDRLWVSHLHRAFPAGSGDRAEVAVLMSNLVPFRNRLAHHETILLRPIARHYEQMLRLSALIDPQAGAWIEHVSRVAQIMSERPVEAT
jgi:hypothetical protein